MRHRAAKILALPYTLLLLAAAGCAGMGLPGTRSPAPTPPPVQEDVVTGEVTSVDTARDEISIDDRGRRYTVGYDSRTRVLYEGREYRPEDLERGDVVRARVNEDRSGRLYADRVDVVESVQARRDDDPYDDRHETPSGDLVGEVERVDTARREIRLTTSHGLHVIEYDSRTSVYYQGETYRPENLEPGDEVRIDVSARGGETPLAESIEVTRSVQDGSGTARSRYGADRVSGTVEWIDPRRGEFGLRTDERDLLTVEIPFDAEQALRDGFTALDRGDYVRVEVNEVEPDRFELVRFL